MYRLCLFFIIIAGLAGCGRIVTPESEIAVEAVIESTSTIALAPSTATATATPPPTATPRPATPIPSPTVTPTPTPIFYAIQGGDTLLSVAIEFGTSPELIQKVNGIVDPRLLQIGQELLIPPPAADENVPPTPTVTPLPLLIKAVNFQRSPQGVLWGLGEAHNPGRVPVSEVVIEASLLDEEGVLLAQEAAFTQLDVIPPGESVPFALLFETPPSSFAQYQVFPVRGVPISDQARYYFDLAVVEVEGRPVGLSGYRVTGQLQNSGDFDAENIRLAVMGYDAEGQMVVQRQADLAVTRLKAEAITPFEIDLTDPQGIIAEVKVVVQGLRAE